MKFYLSLVLVNLFYCGLTSKNLPISGKPSTPTTKVAADLPLNVTVTDIGDNYAVFNITGADTVGGLPVVDLNVEYTIGNQSVATQVKTVFLSSSDGSAMLQELVKITDLKAGLNYHFKFSAENAKKETGPPSRDVSVLLLPPTPDITVEHPQTNKLVVKWGENRAKSEDYFLLTVEKVGVLYPIIIHM